MLVFISYAEEDFPVAKFIQEYLEQHLVEVFLARKTISPGLNWQEEIQKAINKCDAFVLLWSRNASQSKWVNYELAQASILNKLIIPCAIDDTQYHPLISGSQVLHLSRNENKEEMQKLARTLGLKVDQASKGNFEGTNFYTSIEKYKLAVAKQNSSLQILGSSQEVAIEEVFLPLEMCTLGDNSRQEICVEAHKLLESVSGRSVVLGHPGTGKTTLLRFVTFSCTKNGKVTLPIYIRIAKLIRASCSIVEYIKIHIQGLVGKKLSTIIAEDENFGQSTTSLLLDGYDELSENDRREFLSKLNLFLTSYPRCNVVVASRIANFEKKDFVPLDFSFYNLQGLSETSIKHYIWSYAPQSIKGRLWPAIRSNERLLELAQVPFMLAMICASGWEFGTIADRTSLFRTCTQYLLRAKDWEPRDYGRQLESEETIRELENALKIIAVRFFKLDSLGIFDEEEIEFAVKKVSRLLPPREIILRIVDYSGLLQRAGGEYYFIHRSIWEYYVALGMRDEPLEKLLERASLTVWEEPIRLYVGLTSDRELERVVKGLWEKNRGLALRALTELQKYPEDILRQMVYKIDRKDRVRLVFEILDTVCIQPNRLEAKRILLDSFSALARVETDCEVLYSCLITLLNWDDEDCQALATKILDLDNAAKRREKYLGDSSYKFELVDIPGGKFTMGYNDAPDPRERPAFQTRINSFKMGKFPTTNSMYYDEFPFKTDRKDDYSSNPFQPVNNVTWYEAIIFSWWIGCDLPTEAEWEYACRAGGKDDKILFDHSKLPEYAWYGINSENRTHDVGSKKPNSFDLYDMIGNVREWVKDWFSEIYYKECSERGIIDNPQGPEKGDRKVLRGGCFDWAITNLRPTYRPMNPPDNVFFGNGFRVVYRGKEKVIS